MLRRLLLLPLLSPLLALLVVGALNPRPGVSLRLLLWSSPPLPLGAWIALAGAGGAALSAGATSLALAEGGAPLQRQVRRRQGAQGPEPWEEEPLAASEPPRRQRWSEAREPAPSRPTGMDAGRSRAPGEPVPTVAVPFRVIRRGDGGAPAPAAEPLRPRRRGWQSEGVREPVAEPVAAGDDWGAAASDDW